MREPHRSSGVEITNVSREGFSLLIGRKKRFIRFEDFPWFRDASIAQITNVRLPSPHHLHWPELDVDLAVESLDHPERYPLVSRVPAAAHAMRKRSLVRERRRTYKAKKRPHGLLFHPELTPQMVQGLAEVNRDWAHESFDLDEERLAQEARDLAPLMKTQCYRLLDNFFN